MTDRTLPWGDPPNQNYTTGEGGSDPPDGNFVVAETSAGTKLMEWDATATEWVVRGDVNASGQAVTVNSLDAASVSTEELNSEVWLDPSMTVSEMQSVLDATGTGTVVHFETGQYTWDGNLGLYNNSEIVATGITATMADGQTGSTFEPVDPPNAENISLHAHGSEFDGNRSSLSAGEDSIGVDFSGASGADAPASDYAHNLNVYGGEWHGYRNRAIRYSRVVGGEIDVDETYDNGEPGDTAQGGDGVYAAASVGVSVEGGHHHDNERHGVSFAGEGSVRCVGCTANGVLTVGNGNDGINCEQGEEMQISGVARSNGDAGCHINGTGNIDVVCSDNERGTYANVVDHTTVQEFTESAADSSTLRIEADVSGPATDGIIVSGEAGTEATVVSPTVENAGGIGVFLDDIPTATVASPVVESVGRFGIFLGNSGNNQYAVNGGHIDGWNGDDDGSRAIDSGGNCGDKYVVSGVSFGSPQNDVGAIRIRDGDYHAVTGNATGGRAVSANGTNSVVANNS